MARKVNVTCFGVLGFSKVETKKNHQGHVWTQFIKLMLEHKGDNREEMKIFQSDSLNDSAWSILYAGDKVSLCKV